MGQTNAGPNGVLTAVGQYPGVQSPWGLLDTSGGVSEWTELFSNPFSRTPYTRGAKAADRLYEFADPFELRRPSSPLSSLVGLRLASAIPGPMSSALLAMSIAYTLVKRRRVV